MKPPSIPIRCICTACVFLVGCGGVSHDAGEFSDSGGTGQFAAAGGSYVSGSDNNVPSSSAGGSSGSIGGASSSATGAEGGSIAVQTTASGGTGFGNTTTAGHDTSGGTLTSGGQSTRTSPVLDGTCPVTFSFGTSPCDDYPEGYVCHYMAMTGPPGGFTSVSLPCECRSNYTTGKRVWWCTVT